MGVQYVYMPLIGTQLSKVLTFSHNIRKQALGDVLSGIPDVLFNNLEILGTSNLISFKIVCHFTGQG